MFEVYTSLLLLQELSLSVSSFFSTGKYIHQWKLWEKILQGKHLWRLTISWQGENQLSFTFITNFLFLVPASQKEFQYQGIQKMIQVVLCAFLFKRKMRTKSVLQSFLDYLCQILTNDQLYISRLFWSFLSQSTIEMKWAISKGWVIKKPSQTISGNIFQNV